MRVKICGVRTPEMARAIARAGADFAGLNFVSTSRRFISIESATAIAAKLGRVIPVGVFADHDPDLLERIARRVGLEWIQLHGSETPEVTRDLAKRYRIIKAITAKASVGDAVDAYAPFVDVFLFDGAEAGSGRTFDWTPTGGLIPKTPRPFLLAGGLTPANVRKAIEVVKPFGVDTASGVEVHGEQDEKLIASFVANARFLSTDPLP